MKKTLLIYFFLILNSSYVFGQTIDSVLSNITMPGDTVYLITENKAKNAFLGNSWYLGGAYTFSKSHTFDLNIGRTLGHEFCSGAGCSYSMTTWGVGVSATKNENVNNYLGNVFTEFSFYYFFPFTFGTRLEYLYNFTQTGQYLKPSIGFSLFHFDIYYNYTFKIQGENFFKHGLTLRVKHYFNRKNWESSYYSYETDY